MNADLRRRWHDLLQTWSVQAEATHRVFEDVCRYYGNSGRFYHTLAHVQHVLESVDNLALHARAPSLVQLAAWLHDVIYESRASDNEERSAEWAERLCERLSIPEGPRVADLIRTTKSHQVVDDDADARVLSDADLAILGEDELTYQLYAAMIRREYAWVSVDDFARGRRRVLESFLASPRIYHFFGNLEQPARRNMAMEIAQLAKRTPHCLECCIGWIIMETHQLTLLAVDGTFGVCLLDPSSPIPPWAIAGDFFAVTRTPEELSIVCNQDIVPDGVRCVRGWRCLRVAGAMDFSVVGVLAALVTPLAEAGICIFAFLSFDTVFLMV